MEFLWRLLLLLRLLGNINVEGAEESPEYCGCFDCREASLAVDADGKSCGGRIRSYLKNNKTDDEEAACRLVAGVEYPTICGPFCDPARCDGRMTNPPDPPVQPDPLDPPEEVASGLCGCGDECTLTVWQAVADPDDGLSCEAYVTSLQTMAQYKDERTACHRAATDKVPASSACARACNPETCRNGTSGWTAPIDLYCFPDYAERVSYNWGPYLLQVKESDSNCDPGPNKFSRETVSFDGSALTLRFARIDGDWQASQVRIAPSDRGSPFRYGTFRFRVDSVAVRNVTSGQVVGTELPPSIVFGAFTWDDTDDFSVRENYNKEVDIELSRWNETSDADAQFLVQPQGSPQKKRFYTGADGTTTQQGGHSYEFTWGPGSISWSTTAGGGQRHEYSAEEALAEGREDLVQCLPATNLDVRVNLWNFLGNDPPPGLADDEEVVVVLGEFTYSPMAESVQFRSGGARCSKDCQCEASCDNGFCFQLPVVGSYGQVQQQVHAWPYTTIATTLPVIIYILFAALRQ